jgi:hypothetical protein
MEIDWDDGLSVRARNVVHYADILSLDGLREKLETDPNRLKHARCCGEKTLGELYAFAGMTLPAKVMAPRATQIEDMGSCYRFVFKAPEGEILVMIYKSDLRDS